jgi:signal peptidase I
MKKSKKATKGDPARLGKFGPPPARGLPPPVEPGDGPSQGPGNGHDKGPGNGHDKGHGPGDDRAAAKGKPEGRANGKGKAEARANGKGKPGKGKGPSEDERDEKQQPVTWQSHLLEYGKAIALAVVLALIIRSFVIQAFHIPSGSMIPTFLEGDRVLVSKFAYGVRNPFTNGVLFGEGAPQRGDVVIFKAPKDPNMDFVKRVVGLPGEVLEVREGKILINGAALDDPHGHYDGSPFTPTRNFGPISIPEGQYFMMGDNRDFSNDSRSWGCVDASLLRGKAWRLYWSWDSARGVPFLDRLRASRLGMRIL